MGICDQGARARRASDGQGTILVVEDDPRVAAGLEALLSGEGYDVIMARELDEALGLMSAHHARLVGLISDIWLRCHPAGWDIARCARSLRPDLPILYISADSAHEHRWKGVPDSMMLQKPFAPGKLLRVFEKLLDTAPPQMVATPA